MINWGFVFFAGGWVIGGMFFSAWLAAHLHIRKLNKITHASLCCCDKLMEMVEVQDKFILYLKSLIAEHIQKKEA